LVGLSRYLNTVGLGVSGLLVIDDDVLLVRFRVVDVFVLILRWWLVVLRLCWVAVFFSCVASQRYNT